MYLKTNVGKIDELVHRMAEYYGADIADEYICDDNEMYPDSCSMYYVLQYGLAKRRYGFQIIHNNTRMLRGKKISKASRLGMIHLLEISKDF